MSSVTDDIKAGSSPSGIKGDVKIIDVVGEGWVMCQRQNVQGDIFYMNMETNEVSLNPPSHGSPPAPPLPLGTKPSPPSTRKSKLEATPSVVPVASQLPAAVLADFGDWAICEDTIGEFYYHWPTNQSYDEPPAEVIQLCQVHEQEERFRQVKTIQVSQARSFSFAQPVAGQVSASYIEVKQQPSAARVVYGGPQIYQASYPAHPTQQTVNVKYIQPASYAQPIYQYASDRRIIGH